MNGIDIQRDRVGKPLSLQLDLRQNPSFVSKLVSLLGIEPHGASQTWVIELDSYVEKEDEILGLLSQHRRDQRNVHRAEAIELPRTKKDTHTLGALIRSAKDAAELKTEEFFQLNPTWPKPDTSSFLN